MPPSERPDKKDPAAIGKQGLMCVFMAPGGTVFVFCFFLSSSVSV